MPCRTDDWDCKPVRESRNGLYIADFEAILCGILTVLEKEERMFSLDDVDWDEVGVKKKHVDKWWKEHKKEDEVRRAKEAAAKRKNDLRAMALAKLTDDERKALDL